MSEATTTREESGVHATVVESDPNQVSRRGGPPSAGITYASCGPSSLPVNAIHFPSGEATGKETVPGLAVRRRGSPPETATTHRSSSETNAIRSGRSAGCRK